MSQAILDQYQKYVIANYTRFPVCLVRGEGSPWASHSWTSSTGGPLACGSVRPRKLPAGRRTSRGLFTSGFLWKLLRGSGE